MLTHANLVSNLVDSAGHFTFGREDSALSVLPLSQSLNARRCTCIASRDGGLFRESLDRIGANLREVRPTIFVGVPRIFEKIYARVKRRQRKGKLNWRCSTGPSQWQRNERTFHQSSARAVPAYTSVQAGFELVLADGEQPGRAHSVADFRWGGAAEELGYIYIARGCRLCRAMMPKPHL